MSAPWDALRRSFWFLPGTAMVLGRGLAFALPELDESTGLGLGTSALSFGEWAAPAAGRRVVPELRRRFGLAVWTPPDRESFGTWDRAT